MEIIKKNIPVEHDNKLWEDPSNPEAPSDEREKEQIERQYEEAERRNANLTDKEHTEKQEKNKI